MVLIWLFTVGNLVLGGGPYLSVQQGKLILTIPAGIQLTSLPLKQVPDTSPVSVNGALSSSTPPVACQPPSASGSTSAGPAASPGNFISSSFLYCAPDTAVNATQALAVSTSHALDQSVTTTTTQSALTPESMLALGPAYSGVAPGVQLPQPAWSPVSLSTSASLTLFDMRGKGELPVDPTLLGLPGGESFLLGSPSLGQDEAVSSPLGDPEDMDEDPKILTQLQSVPVDEDLGL